MTCTQLCWESNMPAIITLKNHCLDTEKAADCLAWQHQIFQVTSLWVKRGSNEMEANPGHPHPNSTTCPHCGITCASLGLKLPHYLQVRFDELLVQYSSLDPTWPSAGSLHLWWTLRCSGALLWSSGWAGTLFKKACPTTCLSALELPYMLTCWNYGVWGGYNHTWWQADQVDVDYNKTTQPDTHWPKMTST